MIHRRHLLVLLLLAACGSTEERHSVPELDPELVVPGIRVGPYVLGVSTRMQVLGRGDSTGPPAGSKEGLAFEFARDTILTAVTVTSTHYRTTDDLGVGSSAAEVRRKMGLPLQSEIGEGESLPADVLVYKGVSFSLDGDRVVSVYVGRR